MNKYEIEHQIKAQEQEKTNLLDKLSALAKLNENQEAIATIRLVAKNTISVKLGTEVYEQLRKKMERLL